MRVFHKKLGGHALKPIPARFLAQLVLIALVATSQPLDAHEFWIDAGPGRPVMGESVSADLRVGQDLSGAALPYLDTTFRSMTHVSREGVEPLASRLGDRPAINDVTFGSNGLHILTVETHPAYIVFDTMPEFEAYLAYEGLTEIADRHRARGLPDTGVAEEYLRNARALIQVGSIGNSDVDRPTGMPFEIVVDGTPFIAGKRTLTVRLTWQGAAAPHIQIALFHLPSGGTAPGDTTRTLVETDGEGYAEFPMPGTGQYLLNAVRIEPADGPGSVVWQSHWASVSFDIEP
ncbi:DUF4198 domain-containing protein [Defluviimonas aestuarii]|uniref:DUF4198 domain-containing protein n=1 Tax=Albidovulum aestuarii TaxID=1130726 RepID=UPI00249CBAEE|nr:DUF4198 domain-containing protein [Defluviimonas aestuarii]MDI3336878.1 DUF4198 domain-containing protein [Defluviimonas aestuarii]